MNICLSGGADGADVAWGFMAKECGHDLVHFTFNKHRSSASPEDIYVLSEDELSIADKHCNIAGYHLGRSYPPRSSFIKNLLRRNYYQIKDSDRVYAISKFDKSGKVAGGTAWAVQMFADRFDGKKCEIYMFDQVNRIWWEYAGYDKWYSIDNPPIPSGIWAGIGTRELNAHGMEAISNLFS